MREIFPALHRGRGKRWISASTVEGQEGQKPQEEQAYQEGGQEAVQEGQEEKGLQEQEERRQGLLHMVQEVGRQDQVAGAQTLGGKQQHGTRYDTL